jgi:hypothetical protein
MSGRESVEPLTTFLQTHPIPIIIYARTHNLLTQPGWLAVSRKKEVKALLDPSTRDCMAEINPEEDNMIPIQVPPANPAQPLQEEQTILPDTVPPPEQEDTTQPYDDTNFPGYISFQTEQNGNTKSNRHSPIFMYGHQVPRNHAEAMRLDKENGNTMWADAEHTELSSQFTYQTFMNMIGHKNFKKPPEGYKRII